MSAPPHNFSTSGPSAYGSPAGGFNGTPPPNYLVWSILVTLFCCLPFGIVSIVYSSRAESQWSAGDYEASVKSSRNAKLWAIAALVSFMSFWYAVFVRQVALLFF